MGPGADGAPVRTDRMVRATYSLQGAAAGAPRTVTYWRLGDRLRAEQAGRLVWLEGPAGGDVVVRLPGGGLVRGGPGQLLPHVPVPELNALQSAYSAAVLRDGQGKPGARQPGRPGAPGQPSLNSPWSTRNLRTVADVDTGCVLDLDAQALRGPVAIRSTEFALVQPDPELFLAPPLD